MEGGTIKRKDFEKIEVWIASGENNFTMSRGSFKYKQKLRGKRKLTLVEAGENLIFNDAASGQQYEFEISEDAGGRTTCRCLTEFSSDANRMWVSIPTNPSEHIYGCGETYSEFDLKGQNVRIWVAEHQNTNRISKKLIKEKIRGPRPQKRLPFDRYESYYAQPTFVSSDKYYVHCNINAYSEFDFRDKNKITFYFQEKPEIISEHADSFEELSFKLSELLGRQRKLPDWINEGAILAVQEGTARVQEKIDIARANNIPVVGIWSQDWSGCRRTGFGYQVMWNWQWDQELYPNLDEKIKEWTNQGIRFLGYINPFMAIEKDLYKEASQKGYCVKDKEGKDYLVTITTFPAAMIDFTNEEAYQWYKNLIKTNMIGLGLGGWMADFGEYLPVDCVLASGEDPAKIHNQWPAIWARMNREAIEECGVEDQVFFFTRAGHTGTVASSAMMWTGDHHVDWSVDDGIGAVIPASLSLAMSGFGISHSDVGGYTTVMHMRRSKELLLRWEELNAFSPLYRFHEGNQPVNNVQFDSDVELLAQNSKFARIYAELKTYLQDLIRQTIERGTPVMRPLFYEYDEQWCYSEKEEYLLGKDLLVCPVLREGQTERECRLPEDEWVHIFTGVSYKGGKYKVPAPIGQPPVFVRKASKDYDQLMKIGQIK